MHRKFIVCDVKVFCGVLHPNLKKRSKICAAVFSWIVKCWIGRRRRGIWEKSALDYWKYFVIIIDCIKWIRASKTNVEPKQEDQSRRTPGPCGLLDLVKSHLSSKACVFLKSVFNIYLIVKFSLRRNCFINTFGEKGKRTEAIMTHLTFILGSGNKYTLKKEGRMTDFTKSFHWFQHIFFGFNSLRW